MPSSPLLPEGARGGDQGALGRLTVVTSLRGGGGGGTSTVALLLATHLVRRRGPASTGEVRPPGVLLWDADVVHGQVDAVAFPKAAPLERTVGTLTPSSLPLLLRGTSHGLTVASSSRLPSSWGSKLPPQEAEVLTTLLREARERFSHVVVDLGASSLSWRRPFLQEASSLLFVLRPTPQEVEEALGWREGLLQGEGLPPRELLSCGGAPLPDVHLLVNLMGALSPEGAEDLETLLEARGEQEAPLLLPQALPRRMGLLLQWALLEGRGPTTPLYREGAALAALLEGGA